jgi:arabinogalactan endo-1,4-beta-galactosidase
MRLMIDFHYSDTWADPSNQIKPAAWKNLDFSNLKKAVTEHTTEVLTLLKTNNITPEWVQIGNETGNGMLWEEGKASVSMKNYAELNNAGYDGVKSVFPNAKVIVHLESGEDNAKFRWLFDGLKNNGGKWDVIGMSLYPIADWRQNNDTWQTINTKCLSNMNDMVSRYGSEVMVCEVGLPWNQAETAYEALKDIIAKIKSVPQQKGLGLFYWEPQSYNNWNGYTLGAFDDSGKPTKALNAFIE